MTSAPEALLAKHCPCNAGNRVRFTAGASFRDVARALKAIGNHIKRERIRREEAAIKRDLDYGRE